MQFTDTQLRAIAHGTGPAMVLAGPGSGKTLVITNRTKYLIEERGVRPEDILVITFTKAAAAQMRERFEHLTGEKKYRVTFGTFHAVFFQILKYAYHYTADNILREEEKYRILSEIVSRLRIETEDEKEFLADLAAEISRVKNEQLPLEHYYSVNCSEEHFRNIFQRYQDALQRMRRIDFDDMLVYCCELLRERKDILARWQQRFRYILVDEFQDINQLQYEVVRMLALPENNLFIVGDDDQSIYRFRGAKPEIMLHFPKDYPGAEQILLEDNFRSCPAVIDLAGAVISENQHRFEKKIRVGKTDPDGNPDRVSNQNPLLRDGFISGESEILPNDLEAGGIKRRDTERRDKERHGTERRDKERHGTERRSTERQDVEIRSFSGQEQEALYTVKCIRDYLAEGGTCREIAILTRTNTGGRYLAEKLMEFDIPFQMRDRIPNLYDHWIAGDVLSYLRLALGIRERKDFLQVMNRPKRYIGRDCVDTQVIDFERLRTWYDDKPWMVQRIDKLENDLEIMKRMRPYAAINYIRHGIEYEEYLKEYAQLRKIKPEELFEVLDELQESAKPYKTHLLWFEHIEEYQKTLENQRLMQAREEDAVMLSTFHSAKGLEFEEVFLPDVNEEILPHRKVSLEADIEEERRLLYVGMTRAKKRLHVFYIRERYGKPMEPSRFLEPILGER